MSPEDPAETTDVPVSRLVRVERVGLRGPGLVLVLGDPTPARRRLAEDLASTLSVDPAQRLDAVAILRDTVAGARADPAKAAALESELDLSDAVSLFACVDTRESLTREARRALPDLEKALGRRPSRFISEQVGGPPRVSQLDWLEYCLRRGRPAPDRWVEGLVSAALERAVASVRHGVAPVVLLEGHPHSAGTARSLLSLLRALGLPLQKALCLGFDPLGEAGTAGREAVEVLREALGRARTTDLGPDAVTREGGIPFAVEGGIPFPAGGRAGGSSGGVASERRLAAALLALGVPAVIVADLMELRVTPPRGGARDGVAQDGSTAEGVAEDGLEGAAEDGLEGAATRGA